MSFFRNLSEEQLVIAMLAVSATILCGFGGAVWAALRFAA